MAIAIYSPSIDKGNAYVAFIFNLPEIGIENRTFGKCAVLCNLPCLW